MHESTLSVGGGVVFWSLSEWFSRETLHNALEALGLEGSTPRPRQASACLREALSEVFTGSRLLIRPLSKRDGFVVVKEERGEVSNTYSQELLARIPSNNNGHSQDGNGQADSSNGQSNGTGTIEFQPQHAKCSEVLSAFQRQLGLLHREQVAGCLVDIIAGMVGTFLRPTGGIYWLPGNKLDEWLLIARAVEQAAYLGKSSVYLLRHPMDAEAVRAIQDAIIAEVQCDATRIHAEVMTGELGERALETRRQQAGELCQKINLYEELLNTGLGQLHQVVDQADQAAAAALLLASAQPTEQPLSNAG